MTRMKHLSYIYVRSMGCTIIIHLLTPREPCAVANGTCRLCVRFMRCPVRIFHRERHTLKKQQPRLNRTIKQIQPRHQSLIGPKTTVGQVEGEFHSPNPCPRLCPRDAQGLCPQYRASGIQFTTAARATVKKILLRGRCNRFFFSTEQIPVEEVHIYNV